MRIERIELTGFKSFFEKTVFNFHSGITAVVGPNGCGKSNIVDALRWVLGEQSAKSLRGDSMEDIIFSGSASKKPRGMAEVTLVISGVNNGGTSETGEFSVTRRLYRSGESEYLMNKVPCRLKDIKNVFLDTGLELKTYSILEQGRIDGILSSKPQERRFLIEEVAGVMKYNVRKAEAVQKLESSGLNLQRLQDIINEVKRQINSIDRHAKKAERYKRLFEEIKGIEIKIAKRDLISLNKELADLSGIDNKFKSREAELSVNIHSSDALIEEKKLFCIEEEKALDGLQNKLNSAEKELIEEQNKILLLKNDCDNLRSRLQRSLSRDSELTGVKESIKAQVKDIEQKSQEKEVELSGIEEILNVRNEELSNLEKEIAGMDDKLEASRKDIFNKAEEINALKNEINSLSLMIENLGKKEKENMEDINSIKESISSLGDALKNTKTESAELDKKLKNRRKAREDFLNDINKNRKKLSTKEESLYEDREDLAAVVSRAESLRELDTSRKSAVKDNVKILCQVADVFETPPEYETAIEAALGDKLGVSVVDDHDEIKKALNFVKERKINRSGFISKAASAASVTPSGASYLSNDVIGKAIDFIKVKKGFDKIADLLLNDVIIVDNLNTAFDLWHKSSIVSQAGNKPGYFVTLDGEVLEPSGIVFGGTEKGILKIKREIKELEENVKNKKSYISSAEEEIAALKNNILGNEEELRSTEEEIFRLEKTCHELEVKAASLKDEKEKQQKKLEYFSAEMDAGKKEKADIEKSMDEKNKICNALDSERLFIEKEMKQYQDSIGTQKTLFEKVRLKLTDIMMSRAAIKEKMESLVREAETFNSRLLETEKKKEEMSKERSEIKMGIGDKESQIKDKENSLKSAVVMIDKLKTESSEVKEILEAKSAELDIIEKRQKTYTDELTSIRKELADLEVNRTKASMKLGHLKEDIKKAYSVDLDSVTGEHEPVSPGEEERLESLREKLQDIGPVNLGTLEELEELKIRYDFLTKQQQDLLQSIESLQETILKINRTTQKKLTDAFEALNEKFKEVFTILFGRGRAELILTEGSILEAGIDVVAQPPGKKLQNLMLLSGGEKALTALSLLFAGFMIKPTPLCLLDEVDAPLDESNTDRFTSLLIGLSKNIQFIAITHNRRTMEVADYLYGVTMEEPGISKVVSMHLAEMV